MVREVFVVDSVTPEFMRWSEVSITIDQYDHPD
jgi:hypothetical protein